MLIHEVDPQSPPVVITTGETVCLAKGIIVSMHVFVYILLGGDGFTLSATSRHRKQ